MLITHSVSNLFNTYWSAPRCQAMYCGHRGAQRGSVDGGARHACSVAKSCPTLWAPMDCSLPGSSVHEISYFLSWEMDGMAISFSWGSSRPRDWTHISCIGRQILYHWATWEARGSSEGDLIWAGREVMIKIGLETGRARKCICRVSAEDLSQTEVGAPGWESCSRDKTCAGLCSRD